MEKGDQRHSARLRDLVNGFRVSAGGFRLVGTTPTDAGMSVIEGAPV